MFRPVCISSTKQHFEGVNYYLCGSYFQNSRIRKRLHQAVYEKNFGEIHKGFHVHHVDKNKTNNNPENLVLINSNEHLSMHHKGVKEREGFMQELQEHAKKWHASEKGREWHKVHYESFKDKLHEVVEKNCLQCLKPFKAEKKGKFCSNACKSSHRRESGVDDIEKTCEQCGAIFKSNKYWKTRFCSSKCGAIKSCQNRASRRT